MCTVISVHLTLYELFHFFVGPSHSFDGDGRWFWELGPGVTFLVRQFWAPNTTCSYYKLQINLLRENSYCLAKWGRKRHFLHRTYFFFVSFFRLLFMLNGNTLCRLKFATFLCKRKEKVANGAEKLMANFRVFWCTR